jgi:CbbQ/NirQ/NorQ C-terminal
MRHLPDGAAREATLPERERGDEVEVFRAAARRGLPGAVLAEGRRDETARLLVKVGEAIRNLDGAPLQEVASTRTLIPAGELAVVVPEVIIRVMKWYLAV